jgi:putative membrane protein insertion efficiency factor
VRAERAGRVAALALVSAYRALLSPFAGGACRFEPSCSCYAAEAIETHGAVRGAWLAFARVVRCRPFGGFGWDPVPPRPSRDRLI